MSGIQEWYDGYRPILVALGEAFGCAWEIENTGGGCMAFHAILEGGDMVLITDYQDTLSSPEEREAAWARGESYGYGVGVYPRTRYTEPYGDPDGEWLGRCASHVPPRVMTTSNRDEWKSYPQSECRHQPCDWVGEFEYADCEGWSSHQGARTPQDVVELVSAAIRDRFAVKEEV